MCVFHGLSYTSTLEGKHAISLQKRPVSRNARRKRYSYSIAKKCYSARLSFTVAFIERFHDVDHLSFSVHTSN